jgi:hypothetical protein
VLTGKIFNQPWSRRPGRHSERSPSLTGVTASRSVKSHRLPRHVSVDTTGDQGAAFVTMACTQVVERGKDVAGVRVLPRIGLSS